MTNNFYISTGRYAHFLTAQKNPDPTTTIPLQHKKPQILTQKNGDALLRSGFEMLWMFAIFEHRHTLKGYIHSISMELQRLFEKGITDFREPLYVTLSNSYLQVKTMKVSRLKKRSLRSESLKIYFNKNKTRGEN